MQTIHRNLRIYAIQMEICVMAEGDNYVNLLKVFPTTTSAFFKIQTPKITMNRTHIYLLSSGLLLGAIGSQGATVVGAWDFNDVTPIGDQASLPDYETDTGTQAGVGGITLVVNEARGDSQPFEINSSGSTIGDTWNAPATAGNAVGFLHGSRVDGTFIEVHFDASSFTQAVTMSFAMNQFDEDGVDTYQASYSTDDGGSFTNLGTAQTFGSGWTLEEIDFGTVFSGATNAIARFQLTNGGPTWNEQHKSYMDNVSLTVVPEPSTYALFAGFLALGGVMLRRRFNA